ncbi:MAG TPA: HDOD domain-containing protein [Chthonomonadales bacterium]|nr:HDOD domain-containing protein [Chthonomonadales bacterium]
MSTDMQTLKIDRAIFQQTLERKLADLPPLPAVVTRVLQTVNSPETSADDLNRLISLDQSLSSKLLRIVNSSYYGFPKRISTVTHAVVILGFNTVRNLVLGVSTFEMLSQRRPAAAGLNRTLYWEHSVAVAVGASLLAAKKRPRTRTFVEEAFISGLLHDIGGLFLDCYFPTQYAVTLAFAGREGVPMVEAERLVLGIDHAYVGKRMADHWSFPQVLVEAFGGHHRPNPASEHHAMAAIVNVADWLAWQVDLAAVREARAPELLPETERWLEFTEDDIAWSRHELVMQFEAARDLVQVAA